MLLVQFQPVLFCLETRYSLDVCWLSRRAVRYQETPLSHLPVHSSGQEHTFGPLLQARNASSHVDICFLVYAGAPQPSKPKHRQQDVMRGVAAKNLSVKIELPTIGYVSAREIHINAAFDVNM